MFYKYAGFYVDFHVRDFARLPDDKPEFMVFRAYSECSTRVENMLFSPLRKAANAPAQPPLPALTLASH